jgi:excisionase family DNA binding protein
MGISDERRLLDRGSRELAEAMRDELKIALKCAQDAPREQLPILLGEIEEVRWTAMVRLTRPEIAQPVDDRLLTVEDASHRLGVSKDYLYRYSQELPFTKRIGRKLLFSNAGIDRYIRQRDGLAKRRG